MKEDKQRQDEELRIMKFSELPVSVLESYQQAWRIQMIEFSYCTLLLIHLY